MATTFFRRFRSGSNKDDEKVDYKNPWTAFSHLLAISIAAVVILVSSLLWTQMINLLITKYFSNGIWTYMTVKFAVCVTFTVAGILLIYLVHLLLGMTSHIEDHMA